jgi:hypothetical protein
MGVSFAVVDWNDESPSGPSSSPDDEMIRLSAELRQGCRRLGLPLVSHDGVFKAAPRLELLTAASET